MKTLLTALSISVYALALSSCAKQEPGYADYWKTWSDDQLNNWSYSTEMYDEQVKIYCGHDISLDIVQSSWLALSDQWAALNGLPYHAITDFNLSFELYAWPDKRNMTEARLSQRIQNGGITESELSMATAPEKGLLALEWLSFNDDIIKEEICPSLSAVSAHYRKNIEVIAEYNLETPMVEQQWVKERNSPEGNSIALNLLFQQVAQLSNRLRTSINSEGEIIPILSEGWRSNTTTKIYMTSLVSILSHLEALKEKADISVNSEGLLDNQMESLNALLSEIQLANAAEQSFSSWLDLQQAIFDTEQLVEGPIAQDMEVLIGFNNYDGD